MIIYNNTNAVILDIPVNDDSYRYRSIMQAKKVELNYSLPGHVELPVGSYVEYQGERYTLWYPENFQKQGTRNFEYKVTFAGNEEILKKYKYKFLSEKPYKLKFPLTAKPKMFLQLLVDNLNLYDFGWSVGQCIDTAEKALSFSHESCMDALNRLADEFSTEWEVVNKTISLCKVERFKEEPLPLSYGRGNGFKTGVGRTSQGDKQPVTLLYVEGGERNIDFSTYKSKTLLLPKSQEMEYEGRRYKTDPDGMYIIRADKELTDYNEDSFDATNFYPSRVGTVSKVEAIKQGENTFYDSFDNEIPEALDYSKCRIDGQKATIIFQSGKLTGKEFDIVQTDKALTGYVHAEKRFKLVSAEIDGLTMPNETFCPEIGDTYAVFNISLPEAYVCDDETKTGGSWDMFKEAVRYFREHEEEAFVFKGDLDGIWAKRNWLEIGGKIQPGAYILFSDIQFQPKGIPIRITGVRDYINKPYSPQIELSNIPVAGFVSSELGKIEENEVVVDHKHKEAISYTQRRFKDAKEQQSLLEKAFLDFSEGVSPIWVQTMSLLVGQEALQFRFVNSKTNPIEADHAFNYSNESKIFQVDAGILQHMTLGIDSLSSANAAAIDYKFWDMEAYVSPALSTDPAALYLYVKCEKNGTNGRFILSKAAYEMNPAGDYYYFLTGTLSAEVDGERSFVTLFGFTEIGPGWMRIKQIISPDGNTYFNVAAGEIGGKIVLKAGSSGLENFEEWPLVDQSIKDADAKIKELDYLKTAISNETAVIGGLLLTSLLKLGIKKDGTWTEKAGINGTASADNDVVAWFGGSLQDALSNLASIVFRLDGSGHLGGNAIRWFPDNGIWNAAITGEFKVESSDYDLIISKKEGGLVIKDKAGKIHLRLGFGNITPDRYKGGVIEFLTYNTEGEFVGRTHISGRGIYDSKKQSGYPESADYHISVGSMKLRTSIFNFGDKESVYIDSNGFLKIRQ